MIDIDTREAIRVRVKKIDGEGEPDLRKFSIDPRITSYEVLYNLLLKAFDMKRDFSISYIAVDGEGEETNIKLLTDWDLEAAFLSASDPVLQLVVIPEQYREESAAETWDIVDSDEIPVAQAFDNQRSSTAYRLPGIILNQVEKTISLVQKAFVKSEESGISNSFACRSPLSDAEFHKFLDPVGYIKLPNEMRMKVFRGGIEPSLRKVVWKHILNVYPRGLSGRSRLDYMKRKIFEYQKMKQTWITVIEKIKGSPEVKYIRNMIHEDVLRTDRLHPFYSGDDDNNNLVMLYNILVTYALNHPSVGYCQGMSDMLSPILYVMKDEPVAYICFCALMKRLKLNFSTDAAIMMTKFEHLIKGILFYDPEFYTYLESHQAHEMLFCYRWLLLELKREFVFDDALYMLEVMWSSLPPNYPKPELPLYETLFTEGSSLCTIAQSSGIRIVPKALQPNELGPLKNTHSNVCSSTMPSSESTDESKGRAISDDPCKDSEFTSCPEIISSGDIECFGTYYDYHPSQVPLDETNSLGNINLGENDTKLLERYSPYEIIASSELYNTGCENEVDAFNAVKEKKIFNSPTSSPAKNRPFKSPKSATEPKPCTSKLIRNLNEFLKLNSSIEEADLDKSNQPIDAEKVKCSKTIFLKSISEQATKSSSSVNSLNSSSPAETEHFDASCELPNSYESDSGFSVPETSHYDDKCPFPSCHDSNLKIIDKLHVLCKSDPQSGSYRHGLWASSKGFQMILPDNEGSSTSDSSDQHISACSKSENSFKPVDKNKRADNISNQKLSTIDSANNDSNNLEMNSCKELTESTMLADVSYAKLTPITVNLPPPTEFGCGNPFLMFLCLSIILLHRDHVIKNELDCNDIAMYFDKLVRKHDVKKVLTQARRLFSDYLQQDWESYLQIKS